MYQHEFTGEDVRRGVEAAMHLYGTNARDMLFTELQRLEAKAYARGDSIRTDSAGGGATKPKSGSNRESGQPRTDSKKARARMIEDQRNAWKLIGKPTIPTRADATPPDPVEAARQRMLARMGGAAHV